MNVYLDPSGTLYTKPAANGVHALDRGGQALALGHAAIMPELAKHHDARWLYADAWRRQVGPLCAYQLLLPKVAAKPGRLHEKIAPGPCLWAARDIGREALNFIHAERWNVARGKGDSWEYLVRSPFVTRTLLYTDGGPGSLELVWDCLQFLEIDYADADEQWARGCPVPSFARPESIVRACVGSGSCSARHVPGGVGVPQGAGQGSSQAG